MSFVRLPTALLSVGISDVVTLALLVSCVGAAASPSRLCKVRKAAICLALLAPLPFVGSVLMLAHHVLGELARLIWDPNPIRGLRVPSGLLVEGLVRHAVCSVVILALGVVAGAGPAVVAAVTTRRLQHAAEQRDLDWQQLRKWAAGAGALLAVQCAWAAWEISDYSLHYAAWLVWNGRALESWLANDLIAGALLLAAAILALVLPLRTANRSLRLARPRAPTFADPSRFPAPPPAISPLNLHT